MTPKAKVKQGGGGGGALQHLLGSWDTGHVLLEPKGHIFPTATARHANAGPADDSSPRPARPLS